MELGLREVHVFVKGPGVGGESAIRPLGVLGLRVQVHQRRHPDPAQRLPARRRSGESERRDRQWHDIPVRSAGFAGPSRGSFSSRATAARATSARSTASGLAGQGPEAGTKKASDYAVQLREKQKLKRILRHAGEAVPALLRARPCACKGMTGENLFVPPRAPARQRGLPDALRLVPQARPGSWCCTATSR